MNLGMLRSEEELIKGLKEELQAIIGYLYLVGEADTELLMYMARTTEFQELLEPLSENEDSRVRAAVANNPKCQRPLLRKLKSDESQAVCYVARKNLDRLEKENM